MSNQAPPLAAIATGKTKYRVTNWPEYDQALVQRGRLTSWFDEAFLRARWPPAPTGKRGAPFTSADMALQARLALKAGFNRPARMVEGLAGSIVQLMAVE